MAIDYGDARVSVAVCDPLPGLTAQGVETIKNTGRRALFERLSELPGVYPFRGCDWAAKNMNSTLGERAQKALRLKKQLKRNL